MYTPAKERYETMEYNRCGESGLMLPKVSLGLWHNFGDTGCYDNMKAMCRTAFDHGITHFDLANNYGPAYGSAERNFGQILKDDFLPYRDELLISTKAGYDMWEGPYGNWGSRKYLIASLDQSLKRLGLEYVDIFYHHRMDPETPLEETMGALDSIVKSGKALYVGLSNYDGPTLKKAAAILNDLKCPFIINQNRYSIFDCTIEENGLKETAHDLKKGIIAFSPLAQGMLTNRYLNGIPADSRIAKDGRFLHESSLTPERLSQIKALNELAGQLHLLECNDYEKELRVHNWICRNIEYDYEGADKDKVSRVIASHNILGVFAHHKAQCEGIAKAVKVLLNAVDVKCIVVTGDSIKSGQCVPHAWNIVDIDGEPYQLDVTWDIGATGQNKQSMVYDYFNLTDELMNQDHKADSSLPVCRSKKANYYVQRGYSFQMRHRLMAYIDRLIEKNERIYEFRAEGRLNKVAIEKEVADHIVQKLHEQGRSSVGIKTCSNRELGIYRIEIS